MCRCLDPISRDLDSVSLCGILSFNLSSKLPRWFVCAARSERDESELKVSYIACLFGCPAPESQLRAQGVLHLTREVRQHLAAFLDSLTAGERA